MKSITEIININIFNGMNGRGFGRAHSVLQKAPASPTIRTFSSGVFFRDIAGNLFCKSG